MFKRKLLALTLIVLCVCSCKKDATSIDCERFKTDLVSNHTDGVKMIVEKMINGLPSKQYTEQNINALVNRFNSQCSLSAQLLCFDCVQTLPSQTELRISFPLQGTTVQKILDISYAENKQMIFSNMHD